MSTDPSSAFDVLLLLLFGLAVVGYFYLKSPSYRGAAGERRVARALRRHLDEENYRTLNNLTLPVGGTTTQIDHVVISRFGIFVIETKNMSGWIFGSAKQKTWTQTFFRRKHKMQNPTHQNYKHVKAVQEALGVAESQTFNVVAFVGSAEPQTSMPPNVVWGVRSLLRYISQFNKLLIGASDVTEYAKKLSSGALENNRQTRREHVQNVQTQTGQKGAEGATCPKCGGRMIERKNKKNGERFLGCSKYPKCRGTRRLI